jgi:capsule polysaccharide export protein KpsC/LpsZ
MFAENQYNLELLNIVGNSSNKQHKAQVRVLEEMTKQLSIQALNLGLADYLTPERKIEIRIDACKEILAKFKEEQMNLKYELEYVG